MKLIISWYSDNYDDLFIGELEIEQTIEYTIDKFKQYRFTQENPNEDYSESKFNEMFLFKYIIVH